MSLGESPSDLLPGDLAAAERALHRLLSCIETMPSEEREAFERAANQFEHWSEADGDAEVEGFGGVRFHRSRLARVDVQLKMLMGQIQQVREREMWEQDAAKGAGEGAGNLTNVVNRSTQMMGDITGMFG